LSEENALKFKCKKYTKDDLDRMIREINLGIIKSDQTKNIWNFYWHESSDDEDNDSQEGGDEEDDDAGSTHETIKKDEVKDKKDTNKEKTITEPSTKAGESESDEEEENEPEPDKAAEDNYAKELEAKRAIRANVNAPNFDPATCNLRLKFLKL
jgi:hypothetical protein